MENCIGEYGICIDDGKAADKGKFTYLVAGKYAGGEVPEGYMSLNRGNGRCLTA